MAHEDLVPASGLTPHVFSALSLSERASYLRRAATLPTTSAPDTRRAAATRLAGSRVNHSRLVTSSPSGSGSTVSPRGRPAANPEPARSLVGLRRIGAGLGPGRSNGCTSRRALSRPTPASRATPSKARTASCGWRPRSFAKGSAGSAGARRCVRAAGCPFRRGIRGAPRLAAPATRLRDGRSTWCWSWNSTSRACARGLLDAAKHRRNGSDSFCERLR